MANKIVFDFSEHNTIKSSDWDNLKKMYDEGKCSGIILRIGLRGSLKSNPTYYIVFIIFRLLFLKMKHTKRVNG